MISLILVGLGVVGLGTIMTLIEKLDIRSETTWRDWLYWFITPLFTGTLSRAVLMMTLGLSANFVTNRSFLINLPFWLQLILALLITDGAGYLSHRLRHSLWLWPTHQVHHSPKKLNWVMAARLHPADEILDAFLMSLPLILLGFDPNVFLYLGPFYFIHTIVLHAHVSWDFGPLKFIFVSPALHHWHHSNTVYNKNFSGVFSFYDVIFKTFYLPKTLPVTYGVNHQDFPQTIWGHMKFPFAKKSYSNTKVHLNLTT